MQIIGITYKYDFMFAKPKMYSYFNHIFFVRDSIWFFDNLTNNSVVLNAYQITSAWEIMIIFFVRVQIDMQDETNEASNASKYIYENQVKSN